MESPILLIYELTGIYKDESLGILLVSSLAGFRGTQYVVPYAATKAWTWNLAEGLYYEFKDTGFDISVCCPGSTDTPNLRSTNPRKQWLAPKPMPPDIVAEEALHKFGKKLFIFPGLSNKISHFILNRILPRKIASDIHNITMKKMYE
jgi:short-subunit dehydrogenase